MQRKADTNEGGKGLACWKVDRWRHGMRDRGVPDEFEGVKKSQSSLQPTVGTLDFILKYNGFT